MVGAVAEKIELADRVELQDLRHLRRDRDVVQADAHARRLGDLDEIEGHAVCLGYGGTQCAHDSGQQENPHWVPSARRNSACRNSAGRNRTCRNDPRARAARENRR